MASCWRALRWLSTRGRAMCSGSSLARNIVYLTGTVALRFRWLGYSAVKECGRRSELPPFPTLEPKNNLVLALLLSVPVRSCTGQLLWCRCRSWQLSTGRVLVVVMVVVMAPWMAGDGPRLETGNRIGEMRTCQLSHTETCSAWRLASDSYIVSVTMVSRPFSWFDFAFLFSGAD